MRTRKKYNEEKSCDVKVIKSPDKTGSERNLLTAA